VTLSYISRFQRQTQSRGLSVTAELFVERCEESNEVASLIGPPCRPLVTVARHVDTHFELK